MLRPWGAQLLKKTRLRKAYAAAIAAMGAEAHVISDPSEVAVLVWRAPAFAQNLETSRTSKLCFSLGVRPPRFQSHGSVPPQKPKWSF
eukprot:2991371-Amphidinium_carterae.1